jgi:hypothetical protein
MTNLDDLYPSKYIKHSDLKGQDVTVTIKCLVVEEVGMEGEKKPVLYFEGTDKGLVMNVTNANTIAAAYGRDTDAWKGKQITLYGTTTDFAGKPVDCVRVRPPASPEMPLDDAIPFA